MWHREIYRTTSNVTVRITGDGSDCSSWKVVIDDPIKEEFDAFAAFREKEAKLFCWGI